MAAVQSYSREQDTTLAEGLEEHEEPTAEAKPEPPRPRLARPYGVQVWERSRRFQTARIPRHPAASEVGTTAEIQDLAQGHPEQAIRQRPPLPGSHHYSDHVTAREHAPLDVGPARPYYDQEMSHGVPVPPEHGGRPAPAEHERAALAATRKAEHDELAPLPDPVPVYIVDSGGGARPLKRAAMRVVPMQAAGADPIVLVPRNPHRSSVRLLNESGSPVRLLYDLANTGGALLPANMTSYLEVDTEDEICAYVPSAPAQLVEPSNPAVFTAYTYVMPGPGTQQLATASFTLAASATVANRFPRIDFTDPAGNVLARVQETTAQVASTTLSVWGFQGATQQNAASGNAMLPLPMNFPLLPGYQIILTATNLSSGDQISGIALSFQVGDQGGALVSVIEQYDVAGGI